jgi:hypothetical protein
MKRLSGGAGFFKGLLSGCGGNRRGDDGGNEKARRAPSASPRELSQEVLDELLFPSSPTPKRGFSGGSSDVPAIDTRMSEPVLSQKVGARTQPHGDRSTSVRGSRSPPREFIAETSTAASLIGRRPQVTVGKNSGAVSTSDASPCSGEPETKTAPARQINSSRHCSRRGGSTSSSSSRGSRGSPKSGRKRSGTPKLSKSLRSLSHNDFTYLGEEAPPPLREHQKSHGELLSLLSSNPLLATEPVRHTRDLDVKAGAEEGEEAEEEETAGQVITKKTEEEYLLSLICECPGANCSVVGLLVFANPSAPALRSMRSGLSALQSALLHGAPLDIVLLLFELEANQRRFAQTPISLESGGRHGGAGNDTSLIPAELLLRGIAGGKDSTPAYRLRTSLLRHSLFMSMVQAWEGSLESLGADWAQYYEFWSQMDALGRATNPHEAHCSFPQALLLQTSAARERRRAGGRASRRTREEGAEGSLLQLLENVARENALAEVVL